MQNEVEESTRTMKGMLIGMLISAAFWGAGAVALFSYVSAVSA